MHRIAQSLNIRNIPFSHLFNHLSHAYFPMFTLLLIKIVHKIVHKTANSIKRASKTSLKLCHCQHCSLKIPRETLDIAQRQGSGAKLWIMKLDECCLGKLVQISLLTIRQQVRINYRERFESPSESKDLASRQLSNGQFFARIKVCGRTIEPQQVIVSLWRYTIMGSVMS